MSDSDFRDSMCGMDPTVMAAKKKVRRWITIMQLILASTILFGGGMSTGYWVRDTLAQSRLQNLEATHRSELEARDRAYSNSLEILGRAVAIASGRVANAADRVAEAAQNTEIAADTAKQAATSARKAIAESSRGGK
jgi:hypothetical protein